ncbi:MAG: hypothetical protein AAEJ52_10975 [Myxococcota bacterium]
MVEDAENGYLVTPDRPAEMAERACPRRGDARVRQCLGSAVREAVANHCGLEAMQVVFEELHRELRALRAQPLGPNA